MGSWVTCLSLLHKNLFTGTGVHVVVSDEVLRSDQMDRLPISRKLVKLDTQRRKPSLKTLKMRSEEERQKAMVDHVMGNLQMRQFPDQYETVAVDEFGRTEVWDPMKHQYSCPPGTYKMGIRDKLTGRYLP